jgi:hypothetical protein
MKTNSVQTTLAAIVLSASLAHACGGDGAKITLNSGLPASKTVNGLAPAELTKLCAATAEWRKNNTTKWNCQLSGILANYGEPFYKTDAEARMACRFVEKSCLQTMDREVDPPCMTQLASCSTTVGEFETCVDDLGSALQQLASMFPTCDILSVKMPVDTKKGPFVITQPASCLALQNQCPEVTRVAQASFR